MTRSIKLLWICTASPATLGLNGTSPTSGPIETAKLPVVEILYLPGGSLLDRLCKSDFEMPVDDQAVEAAAQKRPEFQKQWDAEGPAYLKAALSEVGLDFPYREMQATLTVCLPASTSIPLVIDVKEFLPTAKKPASLGVFGDRIPRVDAYVREPRPGSFGANQEVSK